MNNQNTSFAELGYSSLRAALVCRYQILKTYAGYSVHPPFFSHIKYFFFFFPLEETGHERRLVMQFLIPSGMLVFESSNDVCVSLQQDQQATQRKEDG